MAVFSIVIYNVLLSLGLLLGWPALLSMLIFIPKTRAGLMQKIGFYPAELRAQLANKAPAQKRIWFHTVSVGEFNAVRPLIAELTEPIGTFNVVLSCTTHTGYELARKTFPMLAVFYFPFDFQGIFQRTLPLVQPDLVALAETELWPNFIYRITQIEKIPLILINGRLSPKSFKGYRRIQTIMQPCLQQVSHFYMQSPGDAERIQRLGDLPSERITVAGNLKFDLNPMVDPSKRAFLFQLLSIQEGDTVLTYASTHSGEDRPLLEVYQHLKQDFPELTLILAPRHPERVNEIKGILHHLKLDFSVRSQLTPEKPNREKLVLLDSIGELLTVYSFTTVAVMGGSFIERGGQNPLEALSQGVPVVFGPYMYNFSAISQIVLEHQAGCQVQNAQVLIPTITRLLTQPEVYNSMAKQGLLLLEKNRGAKNILSQAIQTVLA